MVHVCVCVCVCDMTASAACISLSGVSVCVLGSMMGCVFGYGIDEGLVLDVSLVFDEW